MRAVSAAVRFFKRHRFGCALLIVLLIGILLGLAALGIYRAGYEKGREHPRYIAHDTGSTFYFEYAG